MPTTATIPSYLNLYRISIPETDYFAVILAKNVESAKGKFWHRIKSVPFLHAKPVVTLVKRGGEAR